MVKEKTKQIREKWSKFYSIAMGDAREDSRRFLFLYFSWMIFLVLLSFTILVGKNPFVLLFPFQVFELPYQDKRVDVKVFVSDGESQVFSSERRILLQGEPKLDIRELVEEVGRPPHFSKPAREGDIFFGDNLKKLPNLSIALTSIWTRENEKEIVLDFSKEVIQKELATYRFAKQEYLDESEEEDTNSDIDSYYAPPKDYVDPKTLREMEKKKEIVLNLTLEAIRKTLLANYPGYEKVHLHFDGRRIE